MNIQLLKLRQNVRILMNSKLLSELVSRNIIKHKIITSSIYGKILSRVSD
jgi:hypothetical protein